jgi:Tol biopolymer transport system component
VRIALTALFLLASFTSVEAQKAEKVASESGKIFIAPQESPDGKFLAFTQEGYNGILLLNENKEISLLTQDPASGYGFKWLKDGSGIAARSAKYTGYKRENSIVVYSLKGDNTLQLSGLSSKLTILPTVSTGGDVSFVEAGEVKSFNTFSKTTEVKAPSGIAAFIENDKISVVSENRQKIVIDPVSGQRCINAVLSPDGKKVVFEILGGNLFVINSDGTGLIDLGKGFRASWSPDSKMITYTITEDDGHVITSSDIFTISFDGSKKSAVTSTTNIIEMNPSYSANGEYIYFDNANEGAIYRIKTEVVK